jgi:hypothetical protein
VKVIADLVVNHMASGPPSHTLRYPGLTAADFHAPLLQRPGVRQRLRQHIRTLVDLGVDGFRFDAAKHLNPADVARLLAWIRTLTGGRGWGCLEVIDDADTRPEMYSDLASLSDFRLCDRLQQSFSFGGSLRTLHRPEPDDDPSAVSFGRCRMDEPGDGWLANATVLARDAGTPLILARDNAELRRRSLVGRSTGERARASASAKDHVLEAGVDRPLKQPPLVASIGKGNGLRRKVSQGSGAQVQHIKPLAATHRGGAHKAPIGALQQRGIEGALHEVQGDHVVAVSSLDEGITANSMAVDAIVAGTTEHQCAIPPDVGRQGDDIPAPVATHKAIANRH